VTRRPVDGPPVAFFGLAYAIAWGMIPVLTVIARDAGLPDWDALQDRAENYDFAGIGLAVPAGTSISSPGLPHSPVHSPRSRPMRTRSGARSWASSSSCWSRSARLLLSLCIGETRV
jgi:hypothetical protein